MYDATKMSNEELLSAFERNAMRYGSSDPSLCFDPARSVYAERCWELRKEILRRLSAAPQ